MEKFKELSSKAFSNKYFTVFITIVFIIIMCWIVYKIVKQLFYKKSHSIYAWNGVKNATQYERINMTDKLDPNTLGLEYTVGAWLYIRDWNYDYGKYKHVLHLGTSTAEVCNPGVWLHPTKPNLIIKLHTFLGPQPLNPNKRISETFYGDTPQKEATCNVPDIRIQRWTHLGLVLQNKTLDVYINGVLRKSCTFENVPKLPGSIAANSKILHLNMNNGFVFYSSRAYSAVGIASLYNKGHTRVDIEKHFMGEDAKKALDNARVAINKCSGADSERTFGDMFKQSKLNVLRKDEDEEDE